MIEFRLAHRRYKISELKNKERKVLNTTAIASVYASRDPQGRTSDESFLLSSLSSLEMVKVLLVLEKKMKKRFIVKLRRK